MRPTTRFRDDVMLALDELMRPVGLARRRGRLSYRRQAAPGLDHWMHVNFGLDAKAGSYIINPSVGVTFAAIEADLIAAGIRSPLPLSEVGTFAQMLQGLAGHDYSGHATDDPSSVASRLLQDWYVVGERAVSEMSDLSKVINMLRSETPADWCCAGRADRGRLLLLALLHSGKVEEALATLPWVEEDLRGRDQRVPSFSHFRPWFEARARQAR
jgi:hypothetical protein